MILKGNQRGGAKDLALHLLKDENEHVEVHELRGFASCNLMGALNEAYAMSRATRCQRFLYSLSLSPPPQENVRTEDFERAIDRVELKLGLTGQPRAIVFHEKEGRRHAHAVWSRINAEEMRAVQLSHDRRKLGDVSRELFLEHGWKMPNGLANAPECDPKNFTLEEWQQSKRAGKDARAIKAAFQDAWAISDSKTAFARALEECGYKLAKGGRRGFVGVDRQGEVYSVSKWVGVKARDVRARLGDEQAFPNVAERQAEHARDVARRLNELKREQDAKLAQQRTQIEAERKALVRQQQAERRLLEEQQAARWQEETRQRQQRFNKGLRGLFDRLSGERKRIQHQNERETLEAMRRDRAEKDALVFRQMEQRREVQQRINGQREQNQETVRELRSDIREQSEAVNPSLAERRNELLRKREAFRQSRERNRARPFGRDLEQ